MALHALLEGLGRRITFVLRSQPSEGQPPRRSGDEPDRPLVLARGLPPVLLFGGLL